MRHGHHPHHDPHKQEDNARLMVAFVLSLAVLFLFYHFFEKPKMEAARLKAEQSAMMAAPSAMPKEDGSGDGAGTVMRERAEVIRDMPRVKIRGQKLEGSISLKGARIDDLKLLDYYTTMEKKENVALLTPSGAPLAYYIESGWVAGEGSSVLLPNADTVWKLGAGSAAELKSGSSVTLRWDNGQGVSFERTIALDDNYLFTVTDKVTNRSGAEIKLHPYRLIARHELPADFMGFAVLHEGPVGWLDGELHEINYSDLQEKDEAITSVKGGWIGFTDKYWFVSLVSAPGESVNARAFAKKDKPLKDDDWRRGRYQVDMMGGERLVPASGSVEVSGSIFAGVKKLDLLNDYQKTIPHFNLVLDFGMWWFLTKPLFFLLNFLTGVLGHIGFSILALTVVVRIIVFPLANKSFRSMAAFKKVAPQMTELQAKYKNDRTKLQEEIFQLYKRENVNPFSGCWPLLVQIPIFFSLYKVIMIDVAMRHAPFWGWIHDLSAPDPTTLFNLFGLIDWTPPSMLMIGAWPIIMGVTMWLQQRMSPPVPDPAQQQIFAMMPYVVTYMLANFAVGLVIYWAWSNVLSILQQYYIMRSAGVEVSLVHGHGDRIKLKQQQKAERLSKKHGKKDS